MAARGASAVGVCVGAAARCPSLPSGVFWGESAVFVDFLRQSVGLSGHGGGGAAC